ncbi:MAG: S8 family serine peptidase [Flavobacteriales bacterium]|nr:S8 family serine peptidase [Flavobacteriales bacterium]
MWRLLVVLIFLSFSGIAQQDYKVLIHFTDKSGSEYSISSPHQFLSERAINRRQKQSISIQLSDIPVNTHYIKEVLSVGTVEYIHQSKWMNAILISFVDSSLFTEIKNIDCVKSVQVLDSPRTIHRPDNKFTDQTTINKIFDYGKGDKQVEMHNLHFIHQLGFTGEGMQIAVFDAGFSGVDTLEAFAYLRDNGNLLGTKDFVDADASGFYYAGHGRSVLSTMAGYVSGSLIGTAPDAGYYLFRTEESNSETLVEEFNWLAAAEYADSLGVDIINSSLGYTTFNDTLENHTYADMDGNTTIVTKAADWAASKGVLVVNSAGNSGNNNWHYIGAPADADSILTLGAVGEDSVKASFSSYGPTVDGRIKPTVVARGLLAYVIGGDGKRTTSNGTSFSSPIMAGAVACLWQAFPNETNMSIIDYVQRYSHQADNPDSLLGYGIPDLFAAYLELENRNYPVLVEYVEVYPNPITDNFTVEYFSQDDKQVDLCVYDLLGRLILKQVHTIEIGRNRFLVNIDWSKYPDSMYIIQMDNGGKFLSKKVLKF